MTDLKLNYRIIQPVERELFYYARAKNKFKCLYFADYKKNFKNADSFLNKYIYLAFQNKLIDYSFSSQLYHFDETLLYGQFIETEISKKIQF